MDALERPADNNGRRSVGKSPMVLPALDDRRMASRHQDRLPSRSPRIQKRANIATSLGLRSNYCLASARNGQTGTDGAASARRDYLYARRAGNSGLPL